MIVIHPKDKTTDFLRDLYFDPVIKHEYDGITNVIDQSWSNGKIRRCLIENPNETVMMLGHGFPGGLFSKTSNKLDYPDRLIIAPNHVEFLRNRKCICIWCYANEFAKKYGLHGLFTGMFISDVDEAYYNGVYPQVGEIDECNEKWVSDFMKTFPNFNEEEWDLVPEALRLRNTNDSKLFRFNYNTLEFFK